MGLETPWQRARRTRHEDQEIRNGSQPGTSRQVNSGRFWRWKRDNIMHEFLVETRRTDAGSYRVDAKEFREIEKDALHTPPGLLPGIQVDIRDLRLFIMRDSDFQQMNLRLRELEAIVDVLRERGQLPEM